MSDDLLSHLPKIKIPNTISNNDLINLTISIGQSKHHPRAGDHHIQWIEIYFQPKGDKFPYQIGKFEAVAKPLEPFLNLNFVPQTSGKILAMIFCNQHGLFEKSYHVNVL